jgi:hypothetical protein
VLLPPVAAVLASTGTAIEMDAGETLGAQASPSAANGMALTSRSVVWTSSNPAVAPINGSGAPISLQALTYGAATVTATAEGQSNAPLAITVTASYCCQLGQGALTLAIRLFRTLLCGMA